MRHIAHALVWSTLFMSAASVAHTHLIRSTPADQAELATAPTEASLTFAQPAILTVAKLQSPDGHAVALEPLPNGPVADAHVHLPALGPGHYRLLWRATSADGHVMSGDIHFTILQPASK